MKTDTSEIAKMREMLRHSRKKTELAMQAADIMLWEYDVLTKQFFSDNEPLNGYDESKPVSMKLYMTTIHPDDRAHAFVPMRKMIKGENLSFTFEARILLPSHADWQYCIVRGSPYECDANGRVLKYVGTRKNNTVLQQKQQLLGKILNSIPLPIHIKDVENDFRYVFCNEEGKQMFGTDEEKTAYDAVEEEDVERMRKTDLEVFNTGTPYLGVEQITLKNGKSYDTIVRKSVIEDSGKRLLLNIRWDQSLQNDLKRRARLLNITLETMNAFTWFYEPKKDRLSFGDGFDKTGCKASQANSANKYLAHIHPDDRDKFANSLRNFVEEKDGIWNIEYRLDLNDGGDFQWWQTRGMIEVTMVNDAPCTYMFGMTICIESHKQSELQLLKHKEALDQLVRQNELVLNNTNSGLAYITRDYIVQWENISICAKNLSCEAYKKGELCYKSAHNRDTPCENCAMQRAVESHRPEYIKFTLGDNRTVEIVAIPVFQEDKAVEGIVIRVDDVTEREQMIKELQTAKQKAEQSDKLKSAFLANMSHEIRTPLNAIIGFSGLMMKASEQEQQEYMQIINSNNELLLKLINDILDLSKMEAGSIELVYEEFYIAELFNTISVSLNHKIAKKKLSLTTVLPYDSCRVNLDRNRTIQILSNYVTNAIKYTPKGFIEMGYECMDDGIYIYVKDSGIGIPDEKKHRVFHRFEKLDEFAQGTGLGLSICRIIAETMKGKVGFESKQGEGSTFWVKLPCEIYLSVDEAEQHINGITQNDLPINDEKNMEKYKNKTILVAEDKESNYLLVSTILKNFKLIRARDGCEAVEIAKSNHVDMILMDMKMPVMNGIEATEEIRKFNRKLPIIALTAHAFASDRKSALKAGCNEYIVKPVDRSTLIEVIKVYC